MNSWLLAKDLERIAAASDDPDFLKLCELIQENYKYPVDTVLISSGLEFLGHKNANTSMVEGPMDYVAFLLRAMAVARGEEVPEISSHTGHAHASDEVTSKITLNPKQATGMLLDVFKSAGGIGKQFSGFFAIDATGFATGGILEISISVGSSPSAGSFELCQESRGEANRFALQPVTSAIRVDPGTTKQIVFEFAKGQVFHLGVIGEGAEGLMNAFLAEVSVRGKKRGS